MTLTDFKDVVIACAALVAGYVAVQGLNTWSRQLRGGADFDVARKLARATYKLRDEIALCRIPLLRGHEFPESHHRPGSRTPHEEADGYAHVYASRWKSVSEAIQEFDTAVLEAEALWATDIRVATDKLQACLRTLFVSIEAVVNDKRSGGENFKSDREFARKMYANTAAGVSSNDPLSEDVRSAITSIEGVVRPHLKRR